MAIDPVWDVEVMSKEGRRLAEAISNMFPPMARVLLSSCVEDLFWSEIKSQLPDQLEPQGWFWHHKVPGLGIWYPTWKEISYEGGQLEGSGPWFTPKIQERYEARLVGRKERGEGTSGSSSRPPSPLRRGPNNPLRRRSLGSEHRRRLRRVTDTSLTRSACDRRGTSARSRRARMKRPHRKIAPPWRKNDSPHGARAEESLRST